MKKLFLCAFAAALLMALWCAAAAADESGMCGDDLTWTLDDNGTLTISGTGPMWDLEGEGTAPWGTAPLWLRIEAGVTSIGDFAFADCDWLTLTSIPDSVESIGDMAFYNTGISGIGISRNVDRIGCDAFAGCGRLKNFFVDEQNARWSSIGGVLFSKDGKTLLLYPGGRTGKYTVPAGVTAIGDKAFYGCFPTEVSLPGSLTQIGAKAFYDCFFLERIAIPTGVTAIEEGTFGFCGNLVTAALPSGLGYIDRFAFEECVNLKEIAIPDGVVSIESGAFCNCAALTRVTLPESLEGIGWDAFSGCKKLKTIALPSALTLIDEGAFRDCAALTQLTLPDGVEWVGDEAFENCGAVRYAAVGSSAAKALGRAGYTFKMPGTPHDLLYLYDDDGENVTGLSFCDVVDKYIREIEIPDGVTVIGEKAFSECQHLYKVVIPDGVTVIGDLAFCYCIRLQLISFPDSLTRIGEYAFVGCLDLYVVTLPAGMSEIGVGAFAESGICSIVIPSGVTEIKAETFQDCGYLESVEIPGSVESIGGWAFCYCDFLREVKFLSDGLIKIYDWAFWRCESLVSINIPKTVTVIGQQAFTECYALDNITLPYGIIEIAPGTFEEDVSLRSVIIPETVRYIHSRAFKGCRYLREITLPAGLQRIDSSAFSECPLLEIHYMGSMTQLQNIYIGDDNWPLYDPTLYINAAGHVSSLHRADITIPASVTAIPEDAFTGIPKGTTIRIHANVTSIADGAFDEYAVILAPDGSFAAQWAQENGFAVYVY